MGKFLGSAPHAEGRKAVVEGRDGAPPTMGFAVLFILASQQPSHQVVDPRNDIRT